ATGYKIYVYQGSTLIEGAPFSVSGQTINSFDIMNLATSTTYSYKVQAIGDGDINYSDSFLSSAIEFTTLVTGIDNLKNNPNITVVNKKIICPETGDMRIFNMQGGLIESVKNVKTVQTDLPSGIYIVKFSNQNGETKIQKIAIQ
ncbi:MAG TPA: T9SS type A sorting domain-containing protein, partial [Paludibacteraceae bacterium]|nr:T9SS type A sorting domain-containing protein [Paludibacteraceae bacterium]HOL00773.1 T9SS type A sorting domain-containing protein [Paludibacteraceae bacterium]